MAFWGCENFSEIIVPLGQEEWFCIMVGGNKIADIIRMTAEKRRREEEKQRREEEKQRREE